MALLLNVSYLEKEKAKALGAKWDNQLKKWYVEDYRHYPDFYEWIEPKEKIDKEIICKSIFIVETNRKCCKCKKDTPVIGFGMKNFANIEDTFSIFHDFKEDLRLVAFFEPMPKSLLQYVKENYNFKKRYSQTVKDKYYSNGCKHCGALQGYFYLFEEYSSPFEVDTARELSIYEFPLKYDIVVEDIMEGAVNVVPCDSRLIHHMPIIMDS